MAPLSSLSAMMSPFGWLFFSSCSGSRVSTSRRPLSLVCSLSSSSSISSSSLLILRRFIGSPSFHASVRSALPTSSSPCILSSFRSSTSPGSLVGTSSMAVRSSSSSSSSLSSSPSLSLSPRSSRYSLLVRSLLDVNRFHSMKLGLSNSESLRQLLGYPDRAYKAVHVAGTNGKGSVCRKVAAGLECAGYRVGLYTSPHIATFRERIQVNGQLITEQQVEQLLPRIFALADQHRIPATFFELTTMLAFAHFQQAKVDYAVVEVGLGGRLDSTNVITPEVSVITSIGLDHCAVLGNTVEDICAEKAGIIKPGVPVIVGPNLPHEVARQVASSVQSPYQIVESGSAPFPSFEHENNAIARAVLVELSRQAVASGAPSIPSHCFSAAVSSKLPCRFEQIDVTSESVWQGTTAPANNNRAASSVRVIFDVGHNPPAFDRLVESVLARYDPTVTRIRAIIGMSGEKDSFQCLATLGRVVHALHLVQAAHARAATIASLQQLTAAISELQGKVALPIAGGNITATVRHALQQAATANFATPTTYSSLSSSSTSTAFTSAVPSATPPPHEVVLVCGSFYIMAEARAAVGIIEPRDEFELNEYTRPDSTTTPSTNDGGGGAKSTGPTAAGH